MVQATSWMRSAAANMSRFCRCRDRRCRLGPRLRDRLGHVEELAAKALIGLLIPLAANHGLDALDRRQHLCGVCITVAARVFVEEPAPAGAFRHGRANKVVLALCRRLGRDCG
jgi:hypothetical protein